MKTSPEALQEAFKTFVDDIKIYEDYLLSQVDLLRKLLDTPNTSERLQTLDMLGAQITMFSGGMVILSRHGHFAEIYILSRSILDSSVNLCYLLSCDDVEYERYVDFSKRNILEGYETKTKAFKAIDRIMNVPDFRSLDSASILFKKFMSPKKGKDLTRWETEKSNSYEKKIEVIASKNPKARKQLFHAAYRFIYEDASEIAHGTLYGATMCYSDFFSKMKDIQIAVKYCGGIVSSHFLITGALIDEIISIAAIDNEIEEIKKRSNDNFKNMGVSKKLGKM